MTPEEKKNELIEMFMRWQFQANPIQQEYFAAQCAIVAVEEIIEENKKQAVDYKDDFRLLYWQEVLTLLKKEIE